MNEGRKEKKKRGEGRQRFQENKLTSIRRRRMIVQCKEEDEEKMVTDTQTD